MRRRMFLTLSVINISAAVVTASNQTYSGSAKTPTPTVTLNGSTVPSSGYNVTYSNNTNAGTATITVTGKGDYTGTARGTFTIAKATRLVYFREGTLRIHPGGTFPVSAYVTDGSGDGTITYSSSNSNIATINNSTITGVSIGECDLSVSVSEGTNYKSASYSYSITVENRLKATFNVTDTSTPVKIANVTSGFTSIEIDGVLQPSVISEYTFNTTGKHEIKYTLSNQTTIVSSSFENCDKLYSVSVPTNVTNINSAAFKNSKLVIIYIERGVANIGNEAFANCSKLWQIQCYSRSTAPVIASDTFKNIKTKGTLCALTQHSGTNLFNTWMSTSAYYLKYYNWGIGYDIIDLPPILD